MGTTGVNGRDRAQGAGQGPEGGNGRTATCHGGPAAADRGGPAAAHHGGRASARRAGALLCTLLALGASQAADGGGLPRWEAGLAAGIGHVPDYPGADRTRTRGIVLPIVIYRGPVLRIDEAGIRGRVLDTTHWSFDLSATGGFNARHNDARAGMPPIDYLFGLGPQWVYKGLQAQGRGPTLHLKLRAMVSTDLKRLDARGYTIDPEVRWRLPGVAGTSAALTLSLQPTWASEALHRTFYQVDPAQATAQRPAYRARAGYLGTDVGATLSHRLAHDLSWFVTARAQSLHGAANTASPLLRERTQFSAGAGLVWTPWRSSAPAGN